MKSFFNEKLRTVDHAYRIWLPHCSKSFINQLKIVKSWSSFFDVMDF